VGIEIYHKREIADVLRATACASEGSARLALGLLGDADLCTVGAPPERLLHAYRQGVAHALISVGLALGLEPASLCELQSAGASPALTRLLWAEAPHER
jgi:hypothetical protein